MAEIPKNIGWIGVGLMGLPMTRNLLTRTDSQLFVYDVVQENVDQLIKDGEGRVHACHSSKDVADKSDIILSMVPEGSHVKFAYLDSSTGVLQSSSLSSRDGKILIDCSTIDTASSQEVSGALSNHHSKARFYDAPVSGGVIGAEKGSLTFMVGATETCPDWPLLNKVLSLMGGNIFACGGPGLGLTAKLCNNYCSGIIAIAVSEALNLGIKSHMDPRVLANIFHTSTAQSSICDDWNPVPGLCPSAPASNDYSGGFRVELMRKDFNLAVQAGKREGVRMPLAETGLAVYDGACGDERCEGRDSRVVFRYIGGEERWLEKGGFVEGEVKMKRDETRGLIKEGREAKRERTERDGE